MLRKKKKFIRKVRGLNFGKTHTIGMILETFAKYIYILYIKKEERIMG